MPDAVEVEERIGTIERWGSPRQLEQLGAGKSPKVFTGQLSSLLGRCGSPFFRSLLSVIARQKPLNMALSFIVPWS
jgi:hypothetical protein